MEETSDVTKIDEPQLILCMQLENCHSELDFFRGCAAGRELHIRSGKRIAELELQECRWRVAAGVDGERIEKAEALATIECWMCDGKGGRSFDGLFRGCEWCDLGRMTRAQERKRLLIERDTRESVLEQTIRSEAKEEVSTAEKLAEAHRIVKVEAEAERDAALKAIVAALQIDNLHPNYSLAVHQELFKGTPEPTPEECEEAVAKLKELLGDD